MTSSRDSYLSGSMSASYMDGPLHLYTPLFFVIAALGNKLTELFTSLIL